MKMGRRLCDVGKASSLCALGKKQSEDASPTAPLPTAHFDRNKNACYFGERTLA
jgi:hypothetical protein